MFTRRRQVQHFTFHWLQEPNVLQGGNQLNMDLALRVHPISVKLFVMEVRFLVVAHSITLYHMAEIGTLPSCIILV
jgi:hypothetical protein